MLCIQIQCKFCLHQVSAPLCSAFSRFSTFRYSRPLRWQQKLHFRIPLVAAIMVTPGFFANGALCAEWRQEGTIWRKEVATFAMRRFATGIFWLNTLQCTCCTYAPRKRTQIRALSPRTYRDLDRGQDLECPNPNPNPSQQSLPATLTNENPVRQEQTHL